jgi:hypothetical protein
MIGAHITERKFLAMWKIDALEWKEFLAYNIICCYIQSHEPGGYGRLEFEIGCLRMYVLIHYWRYYWRLQPSFIGIIAQKTKFKTQNSEMK